MKAFLDACIIIYWIEAADPFYSRLAEKIRKLEKAHPGISFAVSRLSLLECLVKPVRENDREVLERYATFFQAPDLHIVELTPEVIDLATRLRAVHGLRTPDAIQAACALSLPEKTLFLTNDNAFKNVKGLELLVV